MHIDNQKVDSKHASQEVHLHDYKRQKAMFRSTGSSPLSRRGLFNGIAGGKGRAAELFVFLPLSYQARYFFGHL
jgi:hypothetical protein